MNLFKNSVKTEKKSVIKMSFCFDNIDFYYIYNHIENTNILLIKFKNEFSHRFKY